MPYPNPAAVDREIYSALRLGFRVDRATDTLPQTAAEALFTISGGRVLAYILGEVTTVIQTQANNTQLIHNPGTGTSSNLCADLDISADEVSTLYSITGTPADAMLGAGQAVRFGNPVVLHEGTVDLDCAASNTGSVKWSLWYVPIDEGASVAAA